jgi:hypothetical protein
MKSTLLTCVKQRSVAVTTRMVLVIAMFVMRNLPVEALDTVAPITGSFVYMLRRYDKDAACLPMLATFGLQTESVSTV